MAITFQSSQNSGWVAAGDTTVTKPVGLAVGDLMICHVIGNAATAHGLGEFTSLDSQNDGAGDQKASIGWKIADADDVAASSFAFTAGNPMFASVTRVSGNGVLAADLQDNGGSAANTATPSIAAGVTPVNHGESNLLLMFWAANVGVTSIATYAIGTSNPSWTEGYDVASTGKGAAMAYATRPEFTATGNISCAGGTGSSDWVGQLVSIANDWSVTVAESTTLTEVYANNIGFSTAESVTLTEDVDVENESRGWINESKSSAPTWDNENKS